jgi:pyrroline-5-carboxylate reductase
LTERDERELPGTGTLAVLGTGKLGEALLSGMLRAGLPTADVVASARRAERAELVAERHGVRVLTSRQAASQAGVLLVTVKPQDIDVLVDEIADVVGPDTLLVSFAAGIPTSYYDKRLPEGCPVVRVMTNTPVLVDEAMSAISPGAHAAERHLALVADLLSRVGKVVRVPESQQDAVTALSGSGPAYFYYLVEAMTDAGILLGLPRAVAHDLIVQAALGAAVMLRDSGEHPVTLREAVTSPAGTTINAIRELENHGVRAALIAAIEAARDRSRELGRVHE